MKFILPALALGYLLSPSLASAQGYAGVMPAQQGYHAPPAPAAPLATGLGSPYGGTGASGNTGYATVTGTGGAALPAAEPAMTPDPEAAAPPTSAFAASFAPKKGEYDDEGSGASIYDSVDSNAKDVVERRRQSILRKVDAAQRKAQHALQRAEEERNREVTENVRKTVEEQRRKMRGDDDTGAGDDDLLPEQADQPEGSGMTAPDDVSGQ